MKCFECDKTVQIKKYRSYMYTGVGLANICLLNQRVEVCSTCNTETPILRNPGKLHRAIGVAIALQPTILTGSELRFLRRSAGYKTSEVAGRLSVAEETYSKWENEKRTITPNADRLARLSYLTALERRHPVEYSSHVMTVVEMEVSEAPSFIIAINAEDLSRPAKYLPETHEMFEERDATIVQGLFLPLERTSLDTVTAVASIKGATALSSSGESVNVCNQFAPTA